VADILKKEEAFIHYKLEQ